METYKKTTFELVNSQKNIVVSTSERFLNPVARVLSKKTLINIISEKCDLYKSGACNYCFANGKEIDCLKAWQLTTGKGKKLY